MDPIHIGTSFQNHSLIQKITAHEWQRKSLQVDMLRLDKIHPVISGNKWFKLKHHLLQAQKQNANRLITWGGAYSNHIVALAYASAEMGLPSIGIIRGEEPLHLSKTLEDAKKYGMSLRFVKRTDYKSKSEKENLDKLSKEFPDAYFIPEGGAGEQGVRGAQEILQLVDRNLYQYVICAVGTGTMFHGLSRGLKENQTIIGIPVLKGITDLGTLTAAHHALAQGPDQKLIFDYHFGGYAKRNLDLFRFMNDFYARTGIPLDFVYTAKLMYAVLDLADKGYFKEGASILVIHSGGLQGNLSLRKGILAF